MNAKTVGGIVVLSFVIVVWVIAGAIAFNTYYTTPAPTPTTQARQVTSSSAPVTTSSTPVTTTAVARERST